ncbi:MAG: peptidase C69 [Chloroflexi bacterium RBG_16_50_11]|nr:MAG: peptidase C69 [Chloroflexi bacterium RBG_16_50_11]
MEDILARAQKVAKEAEVFEVSSEETQVRFEANRLKQLQSNQSTTVSLRIIKDGRVGYATTTGTGDSQRLVNDAAETAAFGSEAKFKLPDGAKYPKVEIFDAAALAVPIKEMVSLGEAMIAAITAHTAGIMCDAGVTCGVITVRLINSRGGKATYKKSFFGLDIEGNLIKDTDMLFVGDSESSCHPLSDPNKVTDLVLKQLDLAKNRAKSPTKTLPVIFTPNGVAGALIFPLLSAFNGKTVLEGASPLGDKIGKLVFDKNFSLRDDPTVAYRPASRPCDDEGVASQRTPLVSKGVVKGFLYDLQTAALAGKKSTGNGSRNRGSLPSPAPSALVITPGKTSFDEMVGDIKEGLVIEQLMGAEQGNILGGDFSGNVLLGFKIENGKIVGRVKDTMVSGNVYKILKDIAAIGSEARWVGGFLQTPPFYCKGLSVSSKG